jgi:peptide subunit release factor 1 (eRF1)
MPQLDQITAQLDRLAALTPGPFPFISLYLNLQANERGRDTFEPFVRKELAERLRTYPANAPERDSLEQDAARIRDYVSGVDGSLNGMAIFACSAAGVFEAMHLAAPIDAHRLHIGSTPHLYPLARLIDEYPRYVALLCDSHSARIFVFALNTLQRQSSVENTKMKHHKQGGWAQKRFQRHVENFHLQHAKEVVDTVAKLVRQEPVDKVVVAAEDAIKPLLQHHYPKDLADRIVEIGRLEMRTAEHDVLDATIAALRQKDAETDRDHVDAVLDAYRGGGLACVGEEKVRAAFELGQVDELLVTANPTDERAWDDLIALAHRTSARVRFVEDAALLQSVGGVAASLRFAL